MTALETAAETQLLSAARENAIRQGKSDPAQPCGYCRRCAIHDDPCGCLEVEAWERSVLADAIPFEVELVDARTAWPHVEDCTCPEDARGPWDCLDCPVHGVAADAEVAAQAKHEMDAENAWLIAAENQMQDCPEWAR